MINNIDNSKTTNSHGGISMKVNCEIVEDLLPLYADEVCTESSKQAVIEHLQKSISQDKVSHAYVFHGPDKAGKMMLAKAFAMALQCEEKGEDSCLSCHSCKQALGNNQPDIIYLHHEKPATISVDDIRKQINQDIQIKPYSSPYKIYIIDEAEKMNVQAQNALLKTIEEPPSYAILLLLTDNLNTFLPTILSRCITLDLKAVPDAELKEYLMKTYQIPDYQVELCLAFAQGNVGKAIQLAESEDFHELRSYVLQLIRRLKNIELYELIETIKGIQEYRLMINDFFDFLMVWYRDVLLYKATAEIDQLIFQDEISNIKKYANTTSYEGIEIIIKALEKAKLRLKSNVNFDLTMELLLLTIKEN